MMRFAVSSLGALTSVGFDVATACASQRAGLSRAAGIPEVVVEAEGEEPEPIVGHPIRPYTDGFFQAGRWVRMAVRTLEDLLAYGALPAPAHRAFWSHVGLIALVPLPDEDRFGWPEKEAPAILSEYYLKRVGALLDLPVEPSHFYPVPLGHAGLATAVELATGLMARTPLERFIVLGVDSYLDARSLSWLAAAGRLKTAAQPFGLMPGEAGAAFLLERGDRPSPWNTRTEAYLAHAASGWRLSDAPFDEPALGRFMADAVRSVLRERPGEHPFRGDVYLDLNGEHWKGKAWGYAQLELASEIDFSTSRLHYPCASFGETGAASGALAVCLAVRSFVRQYAAAPRALVCSLSDDGHVGAVLLETKPPAA